jgi:hypothetical protein
MNAPNRRISDNRQALYYGGMAVSGVGLLLFVSFFFTLVSGFDGASGLESEPVITFSPNSDFLAKRELTRQVAPRRYQAENAVARALIGMVLMVVGGGMMKVGARGWAGAGVLLDPEQARKDLEPWARMGGGIAQDALSEIDVVRQVQDRLATHEPEVKVRCPACKSLNDEVARFCNQCGSAI